MTKDVLENLKDEYEGICSNADRLFNFFGSDTFILLDEEEQLAMSEQYAIMVDYREILAWRIEKIRYRLGKIKKEPKRT